MKICRSSKTPPFGLLEQLHPAPLQNINKATILIISVILECLVKFVLRNLPRKLLNMEQ